MGIAPNEWSILSIFAYLLPYGIICSQSVILNSLVQLNSLKEGLQSDLQIFLGLMKKSDAT